MWRAVWALCALFALSTACGEPATDDGGDDGGGDGGDDATLSWPEAPTAVVSGAAAPALAVTAEGTVVLAYVNDGQVWVEVDPPAATPVAVGDSVSDRTQLTAAGSPSGDQALVVWTYGRHVWIDGGTVGTAGRLVDSWDVADRVRLSWTGERPLLAMETGAAGQVLVVGDPTAAMAPAPQAGDTLIAVRSGFRYHQESLAAVDLGEDQVLAFSPWGVTSDGDYGTDASWASGQCPTDSAPGWCQPQQSGTFALPGPDNQNRTWIQAHQLGAGSLALTWAATPGGTMVFDVFLARLTFDATEGPALGATNVNVSDTPGTTDNSDHPFVLPAGDGRLWVAWREQAFGPRVALYDSELNRLALVAPDRDPNLNLTQAIAAAVGPDGSLHLAGAVTTGDTNEVHYWRLAGP